MSMNDFLTRIPVAHRGLHGEGIPENSLAAFRRAIEHGYAIETDIHFTKDGQLAVFHDDTLLRMTGDPRTVNACTMSELRALKLQNTEQSIPAFYELLETVNGQVPLLIEIKNMPGVKGKTIAHALSDALRGYRGDYAVQSFNPLYVRAYKAVCPAVPCGVLASRGMSKKGDALLWRMKAYLLENLKLNFFVKPDFVSYNGDCLPMKRVEKFRGIKLAWTVRSPEEQARLKPYVDNIIFEGFLAKKDDTMS